MIEELEATIVELCEAIRSALLKGRYGDAVLASEALENACSAMAETMTAIGGEDA